MYIELVYSKYKFALIRNDFPWYVEEFINDISKCNLNLEKTNLEIKKSEIYLLDLLNFYGKINGVTGIGYIFSK